LGCRVVFCLAHAFYQQRAMGSNGCALYNLSHYQPVLLPARKALARDAGFCAFLCHQISSYLFCALFGRPFAQGKGSLVAVLFSSRGVRDHLRPSSYFGKQLAGRAHDLPEANDALFTALRQCA